MSRKVVIQAEFVKTIIVIGWGVTGWTNRKIGLFGKHFYHTARFRLNYNTLRSKLLGLTDFYQSK